MKRSHWLLASALGILAAVALCGCDDESVQDAGPVMDGAVDDADVTSDGGDSGPAPDAARPDGALLLDGGSSDGGSSDGGSLDGGSLDGGSLDGGSLDASASDASALDASALDAGASDGGARTTCAITSSPSVGTVDDDFDFVGSSNGASCQARFDGGLLSVPCNTAMTLSGATFGVGSHTIELLVGSGPSGPASCSTSFTVTPASVPDAGVPDAGAATTTCAIEVTPESGPPSATFTASFSSNGAGCTLLVDSFSLGAVPCVGTYAGMGSAVGAGSHSATLLVGSGPSGSVSCSDTFIVE